MKRILGIGLLLLVPWWATAQEEGWVVVARDTVPDYYAAAMANGEIGVTVGRAPFSLGAVILGGAYESGTDRSVARILEGINPAGLSMTIDGRPLDASDLRPTVQQIDMRRAVHESRYRLDGVLLLWRVRALRNMPYALMTEVEVVAERDVEVVFTNRHAIPAAFADTLRELRPVICEDGSRILPNGVGPVVPITVLKRHRFICLYSKTCRLSPDLPDVERAAVCLLRDEKCILVKKALPGGSHEVDGSKKQHHSGSQSQNGFLESVQ